ncbi:transposon-transfer assisting family protein [Ruminococcaceae bacterium OttesenSCG-928-A16]|nr:transposon-transfer assisting family protein [Ruminococcaceae bacterium OttesenSCG-928-A16]
MFTVEEMNLMCIYDTGSRAALLREIRESLPDVYDPELRDIMGAVITKLEALTDDDFSEIGFYADYDDEQEE